MENGRCAYHGGRTPKGKDWHKTRWPNRDAPDAMQKLDRKLKDRQRDEKARKKRLAIMTPEERERHEHWQRTHRPGPPAERARLRADRKQAADARKRLAELEREPTPANPEAEAIARRIAELERRKAWLAALANGDGIFG